MTKKTKHLGRESGTGGGSDRYLSPQRPYTGDGRTRRSTFDKIVAVFRKPNGKKS